MTDRNGNELTLDQLREIIALHGAWRRGEAAGVRANLSGANLRDADLSGANLRDADLRWADLRDANLRWADLRAANLRAANLSSADLSGADLRDADLSDADLSDADLSSADLSDANLRAANLRWADLSGANLRWADLQPIRDDVWAVLCTAPAEVPGLRAAIVAGKIDGTAYVGECACLVGTLERECRARGEDSHIPHLPNRPAERWFLGIAPGQTPENNQFAALAVEWIDQWTANMTAAFGSVDVPDGD